MLVSPGERLLPEFDPELGRYAEAKLREAGIEVRLHTKVTGCDGRSVSFQAEQDPRSVATIPARTVIWTAGVTPSRLIESLSLPKERGRIVVTETMALPGYEGVWACGDCAAVPDTEGKAYPTTAQHAIRQGSRAGRNIEAVVRGRPDQVRPFRYKMIGQLAAIGHRRGVASIFGLRFSGLLAWLLWRSIYLFKLPTGQKKVRVMLEWALDLCFERDTVQLLNVQSVHRIDELIDRHDTGPAGAIEPDLHRKAS
jgi:NADH dehydrogenase